MKKVLSVICVSLLLLASLIPLVACKSRDNILRILSQSEYIDEIVLEQFEEMYDVTVEFDTAQTNEDINSKIKNGKFDYDLICVSDYMVQQMIREGLLLKPNFDNIPNAQNTSPFITNLMKSYNVSMEEYAVGYMWGTMGILYNTTYDGIEDDLDAQGWDIMWNNKYSNKIYMKDSMRDTSMIAAFSAGVDPNAQASFSAIESRLLEQKPLVTYEVDAVKEAMPNNQGALSLQWAGDAIYAMELAEEYNKGADLYYYLPDEFNLFFDAYVIPAYAANQDLAEKFLDFLCDEETAITNMDYLYYTTCMATPAIFDYYSEIGGEEGETVDVSYFFVGSQYTGTTTANLWWIQFPDKSTLYNGATPNFVQMRDFGSQSALNAALAMWSNVRN